jgi:hypothetical protein
MAGRLRRLIGKCGAGQLGARRACVQVWVVEDVDRAGGFSWGWRASLTGRADQMGSVGVIDRGRADVDRAVVWQRPGICARGVRGRGSGRRVGTRGRADGVDLSAWGEGAGTWIGDMFLLFSRLDLTVGRKFNFRRPSSRQ